MRLIISEKPSAAKKIAEALGGYRTVKSGKSYYYEVSEDLIVAPAVGHLYGLEPSVEGWDYPIFEVEWKKASRRKGFEFAKDYIKNLEVLGKKADEIIIATDYDREGGVIGFNILKFAAKMRHPEKALRMKFSTLTKNELKKAYENAHVHNQFEVGLALSGLTRHYLDWYWGINLSRALVHAIKRTGQFKVLSTGRVQGPALKILVDREREIKKFSSSFYYSLSALIEGTYEAKDGEFNDIKKALEVFTKAKGPAKVVDIEKNKRELLPRPPFNLTDLQTEASRVYKITPKETLDLAQKLYEAGVISYPRTSNHDLPKELDTNAILQALAYFIPQAPTLLNRKAAKGKKTDPAHPAIYPTGEKHGDSDLRQRKIYELISRRFVASFADSAIREATRISLDLNGVTFVMEGQKTVKEGFTKIYPLGLKETEIPTTKVGDTLSVDYIQLNREQKSPPKRFTEAGLLKQMEKVNLGTKATRADIIQRLYTRGYIEGKSIKVRPLGENVVSALEDVVPNMLSVKLTRQFEERMEQIQDGKEKMEAVLEDGKKELMKILKEFKQKEAEVGKKLVSGGVEATPSKFASKTVKTTLKPKVLFGACPGCGKAVGQVISRNDKRYAACTSCDKTWGLPQRGTLTLTKNNCPKPKCKFKKIQIKRKDTQFTLCIEHGFN
ncbi:MAG: DNA topoisomerase I [Candidatus Altiarchaeota archaeon]|nr:DNA topoisomerase I [Candidatus Altiarchaeota archaeon]